MHIICIINIRDPMEKVCSLGLVSTRLSVLSRSEILWIIILYQNETNVSLTDLSEHMSKSVVR
jgi:hypothetical protein